jgi:hypothetical protein
VLGIELIGVSMDECERNLPPGGLCDCSIEGRRWRRCRFRSTSTPVFYDNLRESLFSPSISLRSLSPPFRQTRMLESSPNVTPHSWTHLLWKQKHWEERVTHLQGTDLNPGYPHHSRQYEPLYCIWRVMTTVNSRNFV